MSNKCNNRNSLVSHEILYSGNFKNALGHVNLVGVSFGQLKITIKIYFLPPINMSHDTLEHVKYRRYVTRLGFA